LNPTATLSPNEDITTAAQWVAEREPMSDVIPQLKQRFGLSALQASQACALAQKYRVSRKAFG
jgi:hypothetical protein